MPEVWIAAFLLAVLVAAGIWDITVIASNTQNGTVSAVVQDWSKRFPVMPFLAGLLAGHLFWPITRN